MEVLEIKPLKNKKIFVYILDFSKNNDNKGNKARLRNLFKGTELDFVTFDIDIEKFQKWNESPLIKLVKELDIQYNILDIPEYTKYYLLAELEDIREQIDGLNEEYINLSDLNSFKAQNLKSWIDVLVKELNEKKIFIELKLRPQWIVKKLLDLLNSTDKREIRLIHFTQFHNYNETLSILKELDINILNCQDLDPFLHNIIIKEEEIQEW